MKPSILIKIIIATALFAGLAAWVHFQYGWKSTLAQWSNVPASTIIIGVILVFASHLLRALRIHQAYRVNTPVSYTRVMAVSLVHNTVSFLLPMRLGELALPALSKHQLNVPVSYSAATLLVVRLFDLHVLFLLLCFFTGNLWLSQPYDLIVPLILLLGLPFGMATLKWIGNTRRKFDFILPLVSQKSTWLSLYGLSVLIWGIKLFSLAFLVSELGAIPLNHAWLATIIADGSALSPITGFANAGTFEAAFTLPLVPLGYNVDSLVQVAVNLHIFIFVINIAAGIFGFLFLEKQQAHKQNN